MAIMVIHPGQIILEDKYQGLQVIGGDEYMVQ